MKINKMLFNIQIEFTTGEIVNAVIPGTSYLDAILNYYKLSEELIPVQSFTLILNN